MARKSAGMIHRPILRAGHILKSNHHPYHPFIILSSPNKDNEVLFVMCSDARKNVGQNVRLHLGDHPFIIKETALILRRAIRADIAKIASRIPSDFAVIGSLSEEVLRRLQNEAKASRNLTTDFKEDLP